MRRDSTGGVVLRIESTKVTDTLLERLGEEYDAVPVVNALADLCDALHELSTNPSDAAVMRRYSALRDLRDVLSLPLRDEIELRLPATTAVLLTERIVAEAGPAAVRARERIVVTRADALLAALDG